MVLIHIVTNTEQQAIEITDLLIERKLILNALMIEKAKMRKRLKDGTYETRPQTLVIGKTKGLLFNDIDLLLKEKYGKDMPTLYSIAIVNMDWDQADELMAETLKI
ncbi:hypothetical protein ABWH96_14470 [Marivirga tractuosa]|uniref:hypothetical protein n=1 Tax=Marivirga tractuosa TaxID=1006 RepID=UPI0035D05897